MTFLMWNSLGLVRMKFQKLQNNVSNTVLHLHPEAVILWSPSKPVEVTRNASGGLISVSPTFHVIGGAVLRGTSLDNCTQTAVQC